MCYVEKNYSLEYEWHPPTTYQPIANTVLYRQPSNTFSTLFQQCTPTLPTAMYNLASILDDYLTKLKTIKPKIIIVPVVCNLHTLAFQGVLRKGRSFPLQLVFLNMA
jgi:hypothetical protein